MQRENSERKKKLRPLLASFFFRNEERIITEVLPQYFLEYRESLQGTEKRNWSKRFTSQDGTWSGNVFDFYFKARVDLAANYPIMEEIIVKLCAQKPLMVKELAHFLERTPDGLRNNYFAKLLSKGKIGLNYPDQLNHPKQAYMVAGKKTSKFNPCLIQEKERLK